MRRLALLLAVIVSTVAAAVGGLTWGSSAHAAPARPDLVVDATVSAAEVPVAGGQVQLAIVVRNVGSASARDVALKLRLPRGATLGGGEPGALRRPAAAADADTPFWQCDFGGTWRCTYGAVAAGSQADTLNLPLRLPAASVGDVVTVSATVSTSSLEAAADNNTDKARITYTAVADLAMELLFADTEVSNLGGRSSVQARVTNVGTAEVADVRLTMDPPPGGRVQLENFTTDEWQCEVAAAPWVCTRGALAPGAFAYLNIPLLFSPGTTGDTMTMTATASTTTSERSLTNNSAETTFRYITPEPADLVLLGMDVYPPQVVAGDDISIYIDVDNIGGSPADNATVRLPLPDTVQPVSADGGDDWTCTVGQDAGSGQRVWDCVKPRFHPESLEFVSPIQLVATVGAGTPEGTLTFTATARTDSPEPNTDNNTLQASTTYQAQGFISGRVWLDENRDGQRDADEPPVANGGDGVRALRLMKEGLVYPAWDTPVAYVGGDGTYTQPLAPGRYFVRVEVSPTLDYTTPNVGDEATDSDVALTTRGYYEVTAESAVVEVVDGRHTAVDIGVVPAQP